MAQRRSALFIKDRMFIFVFFILYSNELEIFVISLVCAFSLQWNNYLLYCFTNNGNKTSRINKRSRMNEWTFPIKTSAGSENIKGTVRHSYWLSCWDFDERRLIALPYLSFKYEEKMKICTSRKLVFPAKTKSPIILCKTNVSFLHFVFFKSKVSRLSKHDIRC